MRIQGRSIAITIYLVALFLPIYWLLNMSFKTNVEIMSGSTCGPTTSPSPTTPIFSRTRPGISALSIP